MSRNNKTKERPQAPKRNAGRQGRQEKYSHLSHDEMISVQEIKVRPLRALTEAQGAYAASIQDNIITFGVGPAGTGKSYVAAAMAADMLHDKEIDKIIITRPAVEAGESFGFLPGELEEKYAPYIDPFRDILNERLGKSYVEYLIKHNRIMAKPLAFMRGMTFKNCWAIFDEAQNATPGQMKLFLTRIGESCKVIVDGDCEQSDLTVQSGLTDALYRFRGMTNIGIVRFDINDIVRHGIVRDVIRAYA
jgi:phosphate starvation-inducible PhoH-like protein